jgi:putative tryptophan/tyrosine transport system substrate-binding protein
MRRRDFIGVVAGVVVWPLAASAQEPGRTYQLGILIPAPREEPAVAAMFDELRLNGFVEGQNLIVIPGGFGVRNDPRELAERAAALVKAAPDAIVAGYPHALLAATKTIPLIGMAEDMVAEGLVASLARPGGNMTGISIMSLDLDGKRQELLMEAAPKARRIAAMFDSTNTPSAHIQELQSRARHRVNS